MKWDRRVEVVCAVVVALAAVVAACQFNAGQNLQAENVAYESWERFLEFSVDNSELAAGVIDYAALESPEREKYERFVDRFLVTAELVLIANPDDKQWKSALMWEITKHRPYLVSDDFLKHTPTMGTVSGFCSYSDSVRDLIVESIGRGGRGTGFRGLILDADDNCAKMISAKAPL